MTRFRTELAILFSSLLTVAVVLHAFYTKKQFYPSVVYLTKSNSSMAVIYLQAFVLALLIGKLMNKIFFGQLRAIEMEVGILYKKKVLELSRYFFFSKSTCLREAGTPSPKHVWHLLYSEMTLARNL
jgi:hypothetical protein